MNKKTLVDLIEELKRQINENKSDDLSCYNEILSKRADKVIEHFNSHPGDVIVINKSSYNNNIDFLNNDDSCEY
tara:strand:+ start:15810 stop:16031 length:222 start_codon:yes stop_codon:yes gene_type:complete